MKKITQQDIANALGMSRISVSKALNNETGIAESTKRLIFEKARELGYAKLPRYADAASPTKQRTNIYMLGHEGDSMNHFWSVVVSGFVKEINASGHNLVLGFVRESEEAKGMLPANFKADEALGILVLGTFNRTFVERVAALKLPTVYIDMPPDTRETALWGDTIMMVNEAPVYEITERMIQAGHREIGFIGEINISKGFQERYLGYKHAMHDYGLAVNPEQSFTSPSKHAWFYTEDEVRQVVRSMNRLPTAFVTVNDHMAIFLLKILHEMGVRVPEDVVLSGYDNIDSSTLVMPSLTTVHFHREELGRRAGEELLWRLRNPHRPFEIVRISAQVLYRESTGKLGAQIRQN